MDANVVFAAAISPTGRSALLFEKATSRELVLVASGHVLGEARRNVGARYPDAVERFEALAAAVERCGEAPPDLVAWARDLGLPDNDAPVLAAAVHVRADGLVTGDRRHFGHLFGQTVRGVRVMTLRDATG